MYNLLRYTSMLSIYRYCLLSWMGSFFPVLLLSIGPFPGPLYCLTNPVFLLRVCQSLLRSQYYIVKYIMLWPTRETWNFKVFRIIYCGYSSYILFKDFNSLIMKIIDIYQFATVVFCNVWEWNPIIAILVMIAWAWVHGIGKYMLRER